MCNKITHGKCHEMQNKKMIEVLTMGESKKGISTQIIQSKKTKVLSSCVPR